MSSSVVVHFNVQSLLVLVALAACVSAAEDMESAEQYFRTYGYWPSWYSGVYTGAGLYNGAYAGLYRSGLPLVYNYGVSPYSYLPAHYAVAPVAVAEKKVEEKKVHKRSVTDEKQDQESAEFFYRTYGYYPSWYTGAYYGPPFSFCSVCFWFC